MRTVQWNEEQTKHLHERLASVDSPYLREIYLKTLEKNEEYERTLLTIYENVSRLCSDSYLKHCVLSAIKGVVPENRFTRDEEVVE